MPWTLRNRLCHALPVMLGLVMAWACSAERRPGPDSEARPASDRTRAAERTLVVFAAASLRDAFQAMGKEFGAGHGARVTFNFAGSHELRTQIEHGAAVDVIASADHVQMEPLIRQELVGPTHVFARNEPVVVVPRGAARVKAFQDLARAERIVLGAPDVPIGRYTRQILDKAAARWPGFDDEVRDAVVSEELSVRQVLAKIALGEADAGIVYRTDAAVAPRKVDVIAIPADLNVVAEYPMAVVAAAPHPELARAFVEYVRSAPGQDIMARFGFVPITSASGSAPRGAP